jgi:CRP-like cAMP-binding protein
VKNQHFPIAPVPGTFENLFCQNNFLQTLVSKLGTCLSVPEEEIITQGDEGLDMFFLSKGDCVVLIKNESGDLSILNNLITTGDHFGEISLIYKCKRTSTVLSRNYNTMGRLSYVDWRFLINEFPSYVSFLKKNLFKYNDERKQFMLGLLEQVEYIQKLSKGIKHDIIYTFEEKWYEQGQMIQKVGQQVDSILFVQYGEVDVYTEFEANEFMIERLHAGSCINKAQFLIGDILHVNYKCRKNCKILQLSQKAFMGIIQRHEIVKIGIQVLQNRLLNDFKRPLDYIVCVPKILKDHRISNECHKQILQRRNILKNVSFQIILKIREERSRPTLQQVLKKFRDNHQSGQNVYLYLHKLYRRNNTMNQQCLHDRQYEYLVSKYDCLQKMIDIHSNAFETLHKIVDKYHVRRMQRENLWVKEGLPNRDMGQPLNQSF